MLLNTSLAEVPICSKKELLLFLVQENITTTLSIATSSGRELRGSIKNITEHNEEGFILLIQLMQSNDFVHIALDKIEYINFENPDDIVHILSKGELNTPVSYQAVTTLDVRRHLKNFCDEVLQECGVRIEELRLHVNSKQTDLSSQQYERALILSDQIKRVLLDLLQEEDAKTSWSTSIESISLFDAKNLKVEKSNQIVAIHYSFCTLNEIDLDTNDLKNQLLSLL